MSAEEFDEVLPFLKGTMSEDRCAAARAVLVDGEPLASVARTYECSRQFVDKTVTIACGAVPLAEAFDWSQKKKSLPGWESITVSLPSELLNRLRFEIAEAAASERLKAQEKKMRKQK
jgi:hypothetical protein